MILTWTQFKTRLCSVAEVRGWALLGLRLTGELLDDLRLHLSPGLEMVGNRVDVIVDDKLNLLLVRNGDDAVISFGGFTNKEATAQVVDHRHLAYVDGDTAFVCLDINLHVLLGLANHVHGCFVGSPDGSFGANDL